MFSLVDWTDTGIDDCKMYILKAYYGFVFLCNVAQC